MEQQAIEDLEKLCVLMYETQDINVREHAQKVLVSLVDDPHVLVKCQMLMQRASSPFALVIAASTLMKKVTPTRQGPPLPVQERLDIRIYVLNYLYTGPNQPPYVEDEMMQLYCRITKISWFESIKNEWVFRNVIPEISKFMQGDVDKCITGVQLFKKLVSDMNSLTNLKPLTKHWKVASSFRDTALFEIFQLACDLLTRALPSANQMQANQTRLVGAVLELSLACLSFDFIGTSVDESGDDFCTVQIPTSWKSSFVNLSTSQLFFNLYNKLPQSLTSVVIPCLVQIVSIRRSLFNNAERSKFLNDVIKGIKEMLEFSQKLAEESAFHEFCRMLARLKANYQLSELVKVPCYRESIELIAKFTVSSLRHYHFSQNSIHYLLSLWQRLAGSVPYVKSQEPHQLETYMPEVLKAFMESRMESVQIALRDGSEVFEDLNFIQQQLEQISTIARCEYPASCQLLVLTFDESINNLRGLLQKDSTKQQLQLIFGKLTWIVYLIGAVIGGRVSFAATEDHDAMDGELVIRVLQLMNVTDERLSSGKGESSIDLALLYFFEQFRKIYIGDQIHKSSKVYKRLNDVLQISDDSGVLNIIVNKIVNNLKYWSDNDEVLSKTLNLFNELSVGFSSVRKLKKLSTVQHLMDKDPAAIFPFLNINSKLVDTKYRTIFYKSIGRLLMVDLGEDEERFKVFMRPILQTIANLKQLMLRIVADNSTDLREIAMKTMTAVARDLRGIIYSFNTKISYTMLFDMIHPDFTELLRKALEIWYHEPEVTTPVLKLFTELVLNRGQRLQFDISSPNGILLFKEASKAVCIYGNCTMESGEPPKDKMYSHRLKGMSLTFRLLKNALCGGYVNFGMFRLYNDPCLEDGLNVFIKLLTTLPSTSYLMEYPKLSTSYYALVEVATQDHITFLSGLPATVIYHLLSTIIDGVTAIDTTTSTSCCISLDNVVSYLYRTHARTQLLSNGDAMSARGKLHCDHRQVEREEHFLRVMMERPQVLQSVISPFYLRFLAVLL